MQELATRIKTFADLRWPDRDLPDRLRKLGEEFGELSEAVSRLERIASRHVAERSPCGEECMMAFGAFASEVADCAIVLQDMLIVADMTGTLADFMAAKMDVNEWREWEQEGSEAG